MSDAFPRSGDEEDVQPFHDDDEIPAEDLPSPESQPETQGEDPVIAELGDEGEGDLSAADL